MVRPVQLMALLLAVLTVLPAGSAFVAAPTVPLDAATSPATPVVPFTVAEVGPAKTETDVLAQAIADGLPIENGKVVEVDAPAGPGISAACPASSAPTVLTSGTPVQGTDPSTSTSDDCHYKISTAGLDLTGKRLRVNVSGTISDHDPYVKLDTPATASPYACSSASGNANFDECSVDAPLSVGEYYIRISRFSSTLSDFNVTAFVEDLPLCPLGFGPNPLTAGVNVTSTLPGATGARCYFTFTSSSNLVRVNMTPALTTDNYNLYVRRAFLPTSVSPNFDCSSLLSGVSTDTCNVVNNATTFFAMVLRSTGTNASASFNIRFDELGGCTLGNGLIPLTDNVNVTAGLAADANANCQFIFDTGVNADLAKGFVFPTGVNVDLAVRKALQPTNSATAGQFDCRAVSTGTTTTDTCGAGLGPGTYYLIAWRPSATGGAATFNVKAQAVQTCSLGAGTTTLLNNVAQLGDLANEVGAACNFVFAPPVTEDSLRISMSPPATGGDFDLHVKKGALPTTTTYDCRPFLTGNATETCVGANDGSPWYAMVRRFSGSGTFSITAAGFSPCSLGNGDSALAAGVASTASLTSDAGAACFFSFVPDPSAGDLAQVDLTPPTGNDFDLYLRKGARPSPSVFDCKASTLGDVAEKCAVEVTDATPVFAMVSRTGGSGAFSVVARNVASCSLGLGNNALGEASAVAADLVSFAGAKCFFVYGADAARGDSMRFTMTPPSGSNFDVYAKRGARPTTSSYDCRPFLAGSATETCELEVLANGPVYLMVRSSAGGGSFSVNGAGYDTCSLGPGVHALGDGVRTAGSLTANAWAKCWYAFQPAANADFVNYRMELTTSDFDLYVRKSAVPTASLWDCRPYTGGTTAEECNALLEDGSAYYGMVKRFSGSGAFNVTASNIILPQLGELVPLPGNVATGQFQYWKVVVPADAIHLSVAIVGDPAAAVCGVHAAAALLCNPRPLVDEVACGLDPAVCDAKNQTFAAACPNAPQLCAPVDTTNADLYVRHIADPRAPRGLPTTSLFSCKSATPGTLETCTFDTALNQTTAGAPLPANVPVLPMPSGGGKFFIGVRGVDGPARYFIAAAWLLPAPPAGAPPLPGTPALPPLPVPPALPPLPPLPP